MSSPKAAPSKVKRTLHPRKGRAFLPFLVLTLGLCFTFLVSFYFSRMADEQDQSRFKISVQQVDGGIRARIQTSIALLRAGTGLFAASNNVDATEFQKFVQQIQLQKNYPGIQGMGFSRKFSAREKEAVIAEARKAGQWGFWKVPAEVAGPDDPIPFPKRVTYFDYEGEIAIVIGKRGKDIPAAQVKDYVWGVTLFHDWSIRDIGGTDRVVSYNLQKNFDGAVSMGPCIVVGEADPQDIDAETRVNGVVRQSYNTKEMIWPFGEVLEYLSRDFTFVPGDVIAGGTSAGTAADKSRRGPDGKRPLDLFLKIGDTVEVSSSRIGALGNKIVAS